MCNQLVNGCAQSAAARDACQVVAADLAAQDAASTLR